MGNMKRVFEEIITLYEEDYTVKEIATELGFSEDIVLKAIDLIKEVEGEM